MIERRRNPGAQPAPASWNSPALRAANVSAVALVVALAGCAQEKMVATFTSQVIQHDTCRVVGDGPETCSVDEGVSLLRVTLVELQDDRIWIHGLPNGGDPDTSILGTRDTEDGFLFIDEVSTLNVENHCGLSTRRELSLHIDEAATAQQIGTDDCVPLLGRETATTTTTAECDEVHDPPAQIQRIERRRWEKPLACE